MKKFFLGWDVGAWHCDSKARSQDTLCALELSEVTPKKARSQDALCALESEVTPKLVGTIFRGNLREVLTSSRGISVVEDMLFKKCCVDSPHHQWEVTIAIDAPLGWPAAMLALARNGKTIARVESDKSNLYTRRETEIDLINWFDQLPSRRNRPLSAVRDQIGSQSTKAIHFLHVAGLHQDNPAVWKCQQGEKSVTVIETYPAAIDAALETYSAVIDPADEENLVCKKIKEFNTLRKSLPSTNITKGTDVQTERKKNKKLEDKERKDKEDALKCAFVAHLYLFPNFLEPYPQDCPRNEGWIMRPQLRTSPKRVTD